MNILQIAPALEAIETVIAWGAKIYALGSEIITVTTILWCLNFIATAIEKTYKAGYYFGIFYRKHLHQFVIKFIAGVILLCTLAYEGGVIVYNNRHKILPTLNIYHHRIGAQFVYA